MATSPIRTRALAYLRAGNVTVLEAQTREGPRRPWIVRALVCGHDSTYIVALNVLLGWTCTCGWTDDRGLDQCPHVAAVQLVTGHPSAAAK